MIRSGKTLLRRPNREDAFREYQRPQWRRKQRNAEVTNNAQLPEDDDGDEEALNEPEEPGEQNAVAPSPLIKRAPVWMPESAEKHFQPGGWVRIPHVVCIGTREIRLNAALDESDRGERPLAQASIRECRLSVAASRLRSTWSIRPR